LRETPELPAHLAHRLAVEKTRDEPKTLLIAEHSFQGIDTSRQACLAGGVTMCPVQTVTHVSGRSRQSWRDFPPPRIARHFATFSQADFGLQSSTGCLGCAHDPDGRIDR
jgi:hypothetical protein